VHVSNSVALPARLENSTKTKKRAFC